MDPVRIGINGFGRIGRMALRAVQDFEGLEVVSINATSDDVNYLAYLVQHDTVHGLWKADLKVGEDGLYVNGKRIATHCCANPGDIPWAQDGVEYVLECTGKFNNEAEAEGHFKGGAKKVLLSAPAKGKETPTFVMNVNSDGYKKEMRVVSNSSCTTNCLAPIVKVLHGHFGIKEGLMTTIHAVTATQRVTDGSSRKDWRAGRGGFNNIIPSSTGAAKSIGLLIPELEGRLTGLSVRVPVPNGSLVDLTVNLDTPTSYEEICRVIKEASEGAMKGSIRYTEDLMVSSDVIGDPIPAVFDAKAGMMLSPTFAKLMIWYDNEWGYTCTLLRMLEHMAKVDRA